MLNWPRRGGLNVIIDKSVVGKITGDLKDLTLDEAMDTVLAAAGLQSRKLDNTVIVGTPQAMVQLGLNRPIARVFKLSYAHPYDVAMLLNASVFNRGYIPKFNMELKRSGDIAPDPGFAEGGGKEESANNQMTELDTEKRQILGTSRSQTQEGVGFNNAAVDPGTQQIRTFQEVPATYVVDPNGGSTIVVPDVKNRQVLVVGTSEDVIVAEEAIRILDRRPRQVHVQTSLVELTNQGIRQLAANVSTQGKRLICFCIRQCRSTSGSLPARSGRTIEQYCRLRHTSRQSTNFRASNSIYDFAHADSNYSNF